MRLRDYNFANVTELDNRESLVIKSDPRRSNFCGRPVKDKHPVFGGVRQPGRKFQIVSIIATSLLITSAFRELKQRQRKLYCYT